MDHLNLTYAEHLRRTLKLAIPLVGSHVAQFAITLTDTVMLGWYDVDQLAAQVLCFTLFFMTFIFGSGFAIAVMPKVAAAAASGADRDVRRVTRMGLWMSIAFGVAILPLFLWSARVFTFVGQEPDLAQLGQSYMRIVGPAMIPALLVMVFKSYLSALERAGVVLWVTLAAVVANAGLNYVLIFGHFGAPELGLRGAAYASAGVHVLSALALAVYAAIATPEHEIFQRFWRPDWAALRDVFRLGLPIGVTNLAESSLFAIGAVMMGWIGTTSLAAHGVALEIAGVTFMIHLGLSNAATVRTGAALGRNDIEGMKRGARVVIGLSLTIVAVTVVLFVTIPELLIGAFVDPNDPDHDAVMAIGVGLMAAAALFQLADAMQVVALGFLRGVQDAKVPMLMATISYWLVGVPVSYGLGFGLGWDGVGVWLGLASGLATAATLMMARFWMRHS